MAVPRPSRQALIAVAALLAAALGAGLYYHVRIRANRDYLTRRNFRVLAVVGRQVAGSLESALGMMKADLRQVVRDTEVLLEAERRRRVDPKGAEAAEARDEELSACGPPPGPDLCPRLDPLLCDGLGRGLKRSLQLRRCLVSQDSRSTSLPQVDFIDYTVQSENASGQARAEVRRITFAGQGRAELQLRLSQEAEGGRSAFALQGVAEAALPALVEPSLVPGVFESVLLLADDGTVLMAAATDLQVRRLDLDEEADRAAGAKGGSRAKAAPSTTATAEPKAPPSRLPTVTGLRIGGRPYLAFCQPFDLPSAGALCGLTPESVVKAATVVLNPYWLVALTSFVVLGALSWPLLKIVFVGVGERVREFDLVSLGLSLLMGTGLVTLLAFDLAAGFGELAPLGREEGLAPPSAAAARPASALEVDRHLGVLARELKAGIEKEMDDALASLETLAGMDAAALEGERARRITSWSATPPARWKGPYAAGEVFAALAYPLVNNVTWIDAGGLQIARWSTQGYRSPLLQVGDRDYFVNAKNRTLWKRGDLPYFAEVVRSRSSGEPLLMLSTHPEPPTAGLGAVAVALSSPAVSAVGALLPPGYGFALLRRDGRTVLHSEDRHAMDENFLEETDENPALRAALFSGTRALFSARYWGAPHRILVLPLERAPWSLAVFYETDLSHTAHLEILTLAAVFLLMLLLLMSLYAVLGRLLAGGGGHSWLWPLRGGTVRYAGLSAFFLATGLVVLAVAPRTLAPVFLPPLAAAGLAAVILSESVKAPRRLGVAAGLVGVPLLAFAWATASLAGALAAAGLLGAALALARNPALLTRPWLHRPSAARIMYAGWAVSAIFALAAAPAASLYRLSTDHYTGLYVQHVLFGMARGLDAHPLARRAPSPDPGHAGAYRFFYGGDLVNDPAAADRTACAEPRPEPLARAIPHLVPLYNLYSIRMRGLGAGSGADGGWSAGWTKEGARCLAFRGTESGQGYVLTSASGPRAGLSLWPLLPLLLLAVGQALFLHYLARRLFLLDFKDPETVSLQDLAQGPLHNNLLVICAPLSRKEQLLSRPDLLTVDLQGGHRSAADVELLLREHPRPRVLCFERFEVALQSAGQRRALLAGLELAVCIPGAPILLVAETDPEPALGLEGAARAAEGTAEAETRRRWAQLLGHFVRVVAVDRGEPEAFEEDVARAEVQAKALAPEGTEKEALPEAFAALRRECAHHHVLQQVGRVLLEEPDLKDFDHDRVVRYVRELADSYYRGLWFSLPDVHKLVLHQVAQGDLVSLNAGRALSRLLALRLVVKDPDIRIVNESFARFVNGAASREEVRGWQRAEGASVWGYLRAPVLIALVAAAGLLVYSQPDTLLAVLTSVGAVIPLMAKLLDLLRPQTALLDQGSRQGGSAS